MTTRWLITGAGGMLGRDLVDSLAGADVLALTRAELDITNEEAVAAAVSDRDVVVNAAAWTDVDGAESAEEEATRVNGGGPRVLALACREQGAQLVQLSTDYVFDGDASSPYGETDPVAPRSAYGRSKAAGEAAVREVLPESSYIVRTAWLYGEQGNNFVRTMLRLEQERDVLDVVDDQKGQPTWTCDVAAQIVALVNAQAAPGIYHGTSSGEVTWFGLARAVFASIGADPARVHPSTTDRFPRPAPRPAYSVLGHDAWFDAGLAPIRPWGEALDQALPRLRKAS
ncbi:MAG: dTDP-4-dehydrorhamnose reductase [Actinomycetota bacterium]|nr:dTDP-4-dehydrorhamnose reductase [Actinomycetota bacterium]MDQ1642805.1 dTDP-4-dehydrorhamnose reductase [Actinomycetota bacterium]